MIESGALTETVDQEQTAARQGSRRANDTRLSPAWAAIEDPRIEVVTTDVFDTLVFRTVRRPVDAFALIGARMADAGLLAPQLPADAFLGLRRDAEQAARERHHAATGSYEVTIREIYEAFPGWARRGELAELIATEVAVEREVCVPDLEICSLLLAAQEAGKRLVIVSDNYLGAGHLRAILAQPPMGGLTFEELFCSCDFRTGKGGDLWPIVIERLGVRPEQILHLGDNRKDDIEGPSELGVRAVFYEQRPHETEATLDAGRRLVPAADARPLPRGVPAGGDFGLTALRGKVLGTAWDVPPAAFPYWEYGASVLGPALSGFATWVVRQARGLGVTRVNCLMREGTFLAGLIRAADDAHRAPDDAPLEVEPLWLNRHTALVASVGELTDEELERLYKGRSSLTLRQLLGLLGLSLSDLPVLARHADTRMDDPTVQSVLTAQLHDEELRAKAWAHARTQRGRVVELLERAADPNGLALLVDLGWGASIQSLANRALRAAGSSVHTIGLYLLTHEGATRRMVDGAEVYSFLADSGGPHDLTHMVMRSPEILEQVCTADVGSQLGLTADLDPICEELDPRLEQQRREIRWVRRGVHAFHDLVMEYETALPGRIGDLADARPQLLAQLARAVLMPTAREAALFGEWQHDEGRGSSDLEAVAGTDRLDLASHATPRQLLESPMSAVYWPFGLAGRAAEHHAATMGALAAGLLPWEATESDVGIGQASLRGLRGWWGDDEDGEPNEAPSVSTRPTRNISGNSLLLLSLDAPDLQEVELILGFHPHLVRIDFLRVRFWEQERDAPRDLLLADAETSAAPYARGYVELAPNTFAAPGAAGAFVVDLGPFRDGVTHTVEVEAGFAALPMPAPAGERLKTQTDAEDLDRARRAIANMESSLSWRVTKPLRSAKGRARRG
jgi:FMN phosphatase YigB (HAD superfamily)